MKTMKILNLYACLGGNRYKWDDVAKDANIKIEVTAVELDTEAARLYKERFPNDNVIVADAHQYLLDHYTEFENGFVWSSPPCPTHSKMNFTFKGKRQVDGKFKIKYPDMKLYQEIIFLDNFFEGKYVVENVVPYYEPLIPAKRRGRHLYWTNFNLPKNINERKNPDFTRVKNVIKVMSDFHDYDFKKYKGIQPINKMANNLVDYEAGRTIFEIVLGIERANDVTQTTLF